MRIALVAMSGVRAYNPELTELGLTLPGFVERGRTMGIRGVNGSGKSTLLKIVCGYLDATAGAVRTQGRIASILELGTGFNRDFSGRDNVVLYGGLMGFSRKETEEKMPAVVF